MAFVLYNTPAAMSQVRPRMFLTLALVDMDSALFWTTEVVIALTHEHKTLSHSYALTIDSLVLLGNFFIIASYTWTCIISFHLNYVIRSGIAANTTEEQLQERKYFAASAIVMCGVFLPC
jgi:hypothetical protein